MKDSIPAKKLAFFFNHPFFLISLLIILAIIATMVGRYPVHFHQVWQDIIEYFQGKEQFSGDAMVVWLRIPRILMSITVGAALSASGMVYQCLFRNPLVSPDILGISSGACLGAAIAIISNLCHPAWIQFFAFTFGISAVTLSYYLAKLSRGHSVIMLVMAGIVVSSFYNALLSFSKYIADPYQQLPSIVFWMMGGLHPVGWNELIFSAPLVIISLFVLFFIRTKLNIISLGDEEAQTLGVNVRKIQIFLIVFSTIAVGATISITGIIGWIGLVVPHISRILVGTDHCRALPHTIILGSIFVLIIDTIARTLTVQEIPIGIVTAIIGAPFFGYLLLIKQDKGWK